MIRPRFRIALAAQLALALAFAAGCGENAAENKPVAEVGPAQPVEETPAVTPPADLPAAPEVEAAVEPAAEPPAAPGGEATPEAESAPMPESETAATPSPTATTASPVAFSNEDGSTVGFIGSKILGDAHDGGFKVFNGTMMIDPGKAEVSRIDADIDMNSTWADDDKLTGHLKNSDFFDVEKFPTAKFVTTAITPGGSDGYSHTVTGNLTLHGETKSITFPANVSVTDDAAKIESEFVIKRSDFGINYSPAIIKDEVVIKLNVTAPRKAAG